MLTHESDNWQLMKLKMKCQEDNFQRMCLFTLRNVTRSKNNGTVIKPLQTLLQ